MRYSLKRSWQRGDAETQGTEEGHVMQRHAHAGGWGVEGEPLQLYRSAPPGMNAGRASGELGPVYAAVSNEK